MIEKIKLAAAAIALLTVTSVLALTTIAVLNQNESVEDFLALTELVLSWPVAAGGLVFGGGQAIARVAFSKS